MKRIGLEQALTEPRTPAGAERAMAEGFWRSRNARAQGADQATRTTTTAFGAVVMIAGQRPRVKA